jgi:hypothetical protein
MVGAVKLMNESPPDLRPALAYLKAVASEDQEAIRVLTEPGDLLEIVEGLADLCCCSLRIFRIIRPAIST